MPSLVTIYTMSFEQQAYDFSIAVLERFSELLHAPVSNPVMLWLVAPLVITTVFMIFYFGRYQKEELGWNTAFGNTMVFVFVAINLLKELYYSDGIGSFDNLYSNSFTFSISLGLIVTSLLLMFVTSFHLLPKRLAFFLFSAAPVNVSIYIIMTMIYAGVPPDLITVTAGFLFLLAIIIAAKLIRAIMRATGLADLGVPSFYDEKRIRLLTERESRKKKLRSSKAPLQSGSGQDRQQDPPS